MEIWRHRFCLVQLFICWIVDLSGHHNINFCIWILLDNCWKIRAYHFCIHRKHQCFLAWQNLSLYLARNLFLDLDFGYIHVWVLWVLYTKNFQRFFSNFNSGKNFLYNCSEEHKSHFHFSWEHLANSNVDISYLFEYFLCYDFFSMEDVMLPFDIILVADVAENIFN